MSTGLGPDVAAVLGATFAGIGRPGKFEIAPLAGGLNNRVFRVTFDRAEPLLVKSYYSASNDHRDRLTTEYSFLRTVWDGGVQSVPEPFAALEAHNLAIIQFIGGRALKAGEVHRADVAEALRFLIAINRIPNLPEPDEFGQASDACFSLESHMASLERRISAILAIPDGTSLERDAKAFVRGSVAPLAGSLKDNLEACAKELGIAPDAEIQLETRCLSPSDFGFHNALRTGEGSLVFIDFEYAGFDDPAKTISDFFSQEAVPVPVEHFGWFADGVADALSFGERDRKRIECVFPVHRLKWVCMILQEFVPDVYERRRFAAAHVDPEEYLAHRLERARELLDQIRDM